jgi:hypothetical protein
MVFGPEGFEADEAIGADEETGEALSEALGLVPEEATVGALEGFFPGGACSTRVSGAPVPGWKPPAEELAVEDAWTSGEGAARLQQQAPTQSRYKNSPPRSASFAREKKACWSFSWRGVLIDI